MELLIYTKNNSSRLTYIARLIFNDILAIKFRITTSYEEAAAYHGPLLAYNKEPVNGAIQIVPHGLLNEKGISPQNFEVLSWRNLPVFPVTSPNGDFPFDIFTASFYLVSRYEEQLPATLDEHKRYRSEQSIAVKNNFLELPVIDLWTFQLLDMLQSRFNGVAGCSRKFSTMFTFDLDSAYAYRYKGFVRSALGITRSLLNLRWKELQSRARVLSGAINDPNDVYAEVARKLKGFDGTTWFIHAGSWGQHDKPISLLHPAMKKIVADLSKEFKLGIHPSYKSFRKNDTLSKEINRLSGVVGMKITRSRQHYLRFRLPETYIELTKMGIHEEYSMGYPDRIGFRAGTCTPFTFYDLASDETLNLKVYPFAVMDSTLIFTNNCSIGESIQTINGLIDVVKSVKGLFISVWHVDYLSESYPGKGWWKVLDAVISRLKEAKGEN